MHTPDRPTHGVQGVAPEKAQAACSIPRPKSRTARPRNWTALGEAHVQLAVGTRMHTTASRLASTDERFGEAVVTFLEARRISSKDAPLMSREPAEALRAFCEVVAAVQ